MNLFELLQNCAVLLMNTKMSGIVLSCKTSHWQRLEKAGTEKRPQNVALTALLILTNQLFH